MMSEFLVYLRLGFGHILDLQGYDHILFVVALVAGESGHWKRLVLMVTGFTLGHTFTLALATLDIVRIDPGWVEFLIPLTILITSVLNVLRRHSAEYVKYAVATVFGLIHGLGFSNFLRAAIGAVESLLVPLLGFNLGVEGGQLCIVAAATAAGLVVTRRVPERSWLLALSAVTGVWALWLMLQRIPT